MRMPVGPSIVLTSAPRVCLRMARMYDEPQELVHNMLCAIQHGLDNRYEDIKQIRWADTGREQLGAGTCPFLEAMIATCVALPCMTLLSHVCGQCVGCHTGGLHVHASRIPCRLEMCRCVLDYVVRAVRQRHTTSSCYGCSRLH